MQFPKGKDQQCVSTPLRHAVDQGGADVAIKLAEIIILQAITPKTLSILLRFGAIAEH